MRNKMSATMKTMELILADFLAPDQLMEGDMIKSPDQEIVTIKTITSIGNGFTIEGVNDFDETVEFDLSDDAVVSWYVYPIDSED
jgi:hypothetical protein